jgi:antagonist of KipI
MSIHVLRGGMLTAVQDLGRPGLQRYGVSVGGATDALSLRVANLLVGNEPSAAALEITLLGPTLRFDHDTLIAIFGGDWTPLVEDDPVPCERPVWLPAGTTMTFGSARSGCRGYLAVGGGIDVPVVMGSRSTYLLANLGGYKGRALQSGDALPVLPPSPRSLKIAAILAAHENRGPLASVPWRAGVSSQRPDGTLRAMRGAEFDLLSPDSQKALFCEAFQVLPQSDRMGYRLAGPGLGTSEPAELISAAVCPGTIQLPPEGQPILLMADCATVGGYPRIAHLASVDLSAAAQLRPGDFFRLDEISLAEAHNYYILQEADLQCLRTSLRLKFAT